MAVPNSIVGSGRLAHLFGHTKCHSIKSPGGDFATHHSGSAYSSTLNRRGPIETGLFRGTGVITSLSWTLGKDAP